LERHVIDRSLLLADLRALVGQLEADLLEQVKRGRLADAEQRLKLEHTEAVRTRQTSTNWVKWLTERVNRAAVQWVLETVFVRFSEDNLLLLEPFLSSPDAERREQALRRQTSYTTDDGAAVHREWLMSAFVALRDGAAGRLLTDPRRGPLHRLPISDEAAQNLIEFWRRCTADGVPEHDFSSTEWDTRLFGDLYQDLSEDARNEYALLQTPEFVEEFILDRTMTPAMDIFGHEELRVIDPTCGSGNFVLGAFRRLTKAWREQEPHVAPHERVRAALDSVHGVDINPAAVAITRFRLLIAALQEAGFRNFGQARDVEWRIHLAVGDALLPPQATAEPASADDDIANHPEVLDEDRYHVVVGNPPYLTVQDKMLSARYRELYSTCIGRYTLAVAFAERYFRLAKRGIADAAPSGFVGQITANSFMKREFGVKLIESFFARQVELTEIIDTAGAYIPGYGTPTVILVGRHHPPRSGKPVRLVTGLRSEPSRPQFAEFGRVWRAIVEQADSPNSESAWITVSDVPRSRFETAPWMLDYTGWELLDHFESRTRLSELVERIGYVGVTGADGAFVADAADFSRAQTEAFAVVPVVTGSEVRDWGATPTAAAFLPYDGSTPLDAARVPGHMRRLWPYRAELLSTTSPGHVQRTEPDWCRWRQYSALHAGDTAIVFSWVSTHPNFALLSDDVVPLQSAPIIKFSKTVKHEIIEAVLGTLNSSAAAYWLKSMAAPKSGASDLQFVQEPWTSYFEYTSGRLQAFPLPSPLWTQRSAELAELSKRLNSTLPGNAFDETPPTEQFCEKLRSEWSRTRGRMIALQEELDWEVYACYDLAESDLVARDEMLPDLKHGERAFEILLAREMEANADFTTEWFLRHGSTPITELPAHWPDAYRWVVERRIETIRSNSAISRIERPEYKRRWQTEGWDALEHQALRSWLLARMENRSLWFEEGNPRIRPLVYLTYELGRDDSFVSVASLYAPHAELSDVIASLIEQEHVPFLSALRYKPSGLKKHVAWEENWHQQRVADAEPDIEKARQIRSSIPVPPKYSQADFLKPSYWSQRGKLDVPKERFISYGTTPGPSPHHYGWAGWSYRERAVALASLILEHEMAAQETLELRPLLAGLLELEPWVEQWHDKSDLTEERLLGEMLRAFRMEHQARHGLSNEDLTRWTPPAPRRGRPRKGS
jgi:methylase of polypeptide subunit release factors